MGADGDGYGTGVVLSAWRNATMKEIVTKNRVMSGQKYEEWVRNVLSQSHALRGETEVAKFVAASRRRRSAHSGVSGTFSLGHRGLLWRRGSSSDAPHAPRDAMSQRDALHSTGHAAL